MRRKEQRQRRVRRKEQCWEGVKSKEEKEWVRKVVKKKRNSVKIKVRAVSRVSRKKALLIVFLFFGASCPNLQASLGPR